MNKINLLIGLEKGKNFFMLIKEIGKWLLFILEWITMLAVWTFIAIYLPEFFNMSVLMLKVIRMSALFFAVGFLFYWLLYFICEIIEGRIAKDTKSIVVKIKEEKNGRKSRKTKARMSI
jgi:hypothetical protein